MLHPHLGLTFLTSFLIKSSHVQNTGWNHCCLGPLFRPRINLISCRLLFFSGAFASPAPSSRETKTQEKHSQKPYQEDWTFLFNSIMNASITHSEVWWFCRGSCRLLMQGFLVQCDLAMPCSPGLQWKCSAALHPGVQASWNSHLTKLGFFCFFGVLLVGWLVLFRFFVGFFFGCFFFWGGVCFVLLVLICF